MLGIGIAGGQGVSIGLLAAIFVSNLPEAVGSATDMRESGTSTRQIRLLWLAVAGSARSPRRSATCSRRTPAATSRP